MDFRPSFSELVSAASEASRAGYDPAVLDAVAAAMGEGTEEALEEARFAHRSAAFLVDWRKGFGVHGLNVWSVPGRGWAAAAGFRITASSFVLDDMPDGTPGETVMRLEAAAARPGMAAVLRRSAADHAAAAAEKELSGRPGVTRTASGLRWAAGGADLDDADRAVKWLSEGFPGRLADTADLFLGRDG